MAESGEGDYVTRDLTRGSIPRNLFFLAWPQFIEGILRVVDQLADLVWAGFLGHRAIAGMGAAQQYALVGFTARQGMDWSMRALVSRAIGMGDVSLANRVVLHAVTITVTYCFLLVAVGITFTEPLLRLLGISEAVIEEGAAYMRAQFVGQAFVGLHFLTSHALAASGDTLTPMKATLVARLIHIFLSPILVFGLLGVPAVGLAGAAVANAVAHVLSLAYLFWVLFSGRSRLHLTFRAFQFDPILIRQLIKIGLPASVNGMERNTAQIFVLAMLAPFGDFAVAAFTLSRRVEQLALTGSQGLGNAAGTIVGQSLGAGKPERAKETVAWAAVCGLLVNGFLALLIVLFPTAFLLLFTRDTEFLDIARTWLMIQAAGYVFVALTQVLNQSFQGAGDTLIVMIITLATMWAIELPLAFFLSRGTELGQFGIAWAMLSPMLSRPVFLIPYFFWGRWLRIDVFGDRLGAHAGAH
ncbi:MAG: MATE family efflux transporter [Chloroflexi bacterium]|nr:MATE family efflux transporter [Chloroflexota bacterium]